MRSSLKRLFQITAAALALSVVCAYGDVQPAFAAKASLKRFTKAASQLTKAKKRRDSPKISMADAEKVKAAFTRAEEMRLLDHFTVAGKLTGVPPSVLAGISVIESCIDPNAPAYGGAEGIMQIMPQTYVIYVAAALSTEQKGNSLIKQLERHAPRSAAHLRTLLPLIAKQIKEPHDVYRQVNGNTRARILQLRNRKIFGDESTFLEIFFAAHDMATRIERLSPSQKKNSYLYRLVHKYTDVRKAAAELRDRGAAARFHSIVEESRRRLDKYEMRNAAFMTYCANKTRLRPQKLRPA